VPVASKHTTGVPQANASASVLPKASILDGATKTSAAEYISRREIMSDKKPREVYVHLNIFEFFNEDLPNKTT
jgi:hypothetical protein